MREAPHGLFSGGDGAVNHGRAEYLLDVVPAHQRLLRPHRQALLCFGVVVNHRGAELRQIAVNQAIGDLHKAGLACARYRGIKAKDRGRRECLPGGEGQHESEPR